MKFIYVASPYTHKHKHVEKFREREVTRVAAKLTKRYGYAMFLPITQSHQMVKFMPELGGKFQSWAKIDLHMVGLADELWVVKLDGWDQSVGVIAEIEHAKKLKKPIKYINPKTVRMSNK